MLYNHILITPFLSIRFLKEFTLGDLRVPIYENANWEDFERYLKETGDQLNQQVHISSVIVIAGIEKQTPTQDLKAKDSLPYLTPEIVKLIKRIGLTRTEREDNEGKILRHPYTNALRKSCGASRGKYKLKLEEHTGNA